MSSVVLSIDAELAWGFHHLDELPGAVLRRTRRRWEQLCSLLDEYEFPATWAIVGHLFHDSCDEPHRGHPAGERLCETATEELPAGKLWFGDGLVDVVDDAGVDHDVGSHGFTHLHFKHDAMTRTFAERELEAASVVMTERGFDTTSFVFPVNQIDYRDLLAEYGFACYRGVNPAEQVHSVRRTATKLLSSTAGVPAPPVTEPRVDEYGLVDVPASLYLSNLEGKARSILSRTGTDPVVRQAIAGIDRAATDDGVFHMWLHPHNLRRSEHLEQFRSILEHVDRRRRTHDLRVETMADVAERVTARRAGLPAGY